ncbi:venom acid phosphatase Acph-1-like isoform X1 [Nasonia vitripennis]|uniref:Uncharacterized protein n=1 Tax=Nasonia vitripennis TaxID=7425 RepID=A0A7M7QHU4_NASVI|nr:venom acid phosphatase Acph-1-like isoform X1 [Nasonia vitripennis]
MYLRSWYPEKQFDFKQLFFLNTLINIQIVQNATLSDWYNPHVHHEITKGAKICIDSLSSTPALARMAGGPLVRRMLENVALKMNNVNKRKIHLFSGHEFTVYAVAKAHSVTLNHSPAFSLAVLHETYRDDRGNAFVKMFYW